MVVWEFISLFNWIGSWGMTVSLSDFWQQWPLKITMPEGFHRKYLRPQTKPIIITLWYVVNLLLAYMYSWIFYTFWIFCSVTVFIGCLSKWVEMSKQIEKKLENREWTSTKLVEYESLWAGSSSSKMIKWESNMESKMVECESNMQISKYSLTPYLESLVKTWKVRIYRK